MKQDNLRAAREKADKALEQNSRSPEVQMAAGFVYDRLGEDKKAGTHFEQAVKLGGKDNPDVLNNAGAFQCRKGDRKRGEELFLQAAQSPLYRTPEVAYVNAGNCARADGRPKEAEGYFRQALRQAKADDDPRKAAVMLYNEAVVEKATGRYEEALRLFVESLAQYRRLGDVAGEALCLNSLGSLHLDRAEHEAAGTHLRAGLAVCDRHGLAGPRVYVLSNLAEHALKTGDDEASLAHAQRAIEIAEAAGNRVIASAMKLVLARLALRRGDLPAARSRLAESLDLATAIGNPLLQVEAVSIFADLLEAQGEPGCARLVLAFAAGHPSASAALRDAIRARQGPARAAGGGKRAWPGLSLEELAHGIVAEAGTGHAALVARLEAGK